VASADATVEGQPLTSSASASREGRRATSSRRFRGRGV